MAIEEAAAGDGKGTPGSCYDPAVLLEGQTCSPPAATAAAGFSSHSGELDLLKTIPVCSTGLQCQRTSGLVCSNALSTATLLAPCTRFTEGFHDLTCPMCCCSTSAMPRLHTVAVFLQRYWRSWVVHRQAQQQQAAVVIQRCWRNYRLQQADAWMADFLSRCLEACLELKQARWV